MKHTSVPVPEPSVGSSLGVRWAMGMTDELPFKPGQAELPAPSRWEPSLTLPQHPALAHVEYRLLCNGWGGAFHSIEEYHGSRVLLPSKANLDTTVSMRATNISRHSHI